MSAAKVDSAGKVTPLDGRAEPDENITERDVQEPSKLARLIARILVQLAALRRAWAPQRLYFQDIATTGSVGTPINHSLAHGLNGRVNWWVVDWGVEGDYSPVFGKDDGATDANTLVLTSYATGTATICVESAG